MESRLVNLRRAGFACTGAVDVGAYAGDWALTAHACFDCPVIAAEPQPKQRDVLEKMGRRMPLRVEAIALADRPGVMRFRLEETNSRLVLDSEATDASIIEVPVDRLDHMLLRHADIQPNLLKVDVQGSELQVLDGAGDKLHQFEVVILEVSLIRIGPVALFSDVIDYMGHRGYRLYDFLPMYYRPLDGALYQGDAFFSRDDSSLVSSLDWQAP